jgi:hypothetical protein
MKEEELKKIVEEIINPLRDEHIKFLNVIITQVESAFNKGIEVGIKLTSPCPVPKG